MSERTDYEVFESDELDGRIFLQFFSGEATNQFKVECLSNLCLLKGKMKLVRGSHAVWAPYECELAQARTFSLDESASVPQTPPGFRPMKTTIIRASDFPYHLPIENITLTLVNGDMCFQAPNKTNRTKNMTLIKTEMCFRPLELITRPASMSAYSIEEVVFDKLTLLRGRLTIPRPFNLQVEVQLGTPPAHRTPHLRSPDHHSGHSHGLYSPSRGRVHGLPSTSALLRLPLALECFLFLLAVLCWLLFRAYHVTPRTQAAYTLYTVLFAVAAGVVIFSLRGYTLRVLQRWLTAPESNGRSFYVNGWNAWSFAGSVLQGRPPPVYAMPGMFVKAFHDGGEATSLHINLGHGEAPPYKTHHHSSSDSSGSSANRCNKSDRSQDHRNKSNKTSGGWFSGWWATQKAELPLPLHTAPSATHNTKTHYSNTNSVVSAVRSGGSWEPEESQGLLPVPQPILVGMPIEQRSSSDPRTEPPTAAAAVEQSPAEFYAAARDHIASDMFTCIADLRADCGLVMGFLSQRQQFGCIAVNSLYDRVSVHLSGDSVVVHGSVVCSDWLCLYAVRGLEEPFAAYMAVSRAENFATMQPATVPYSGDSAADSAADSTVYSAVGSDVYDPYLSTSTSTSTTAAAASASGASAATVDPTSTASTTASTAVPSAAALALTQDINRVPAGWCSWYHFYDHISEAVLLKNLACMQRMIQNNHLAAAGFSLFQVDDGYQAAWGDWCTVDAVKFPSLSLYSVVQGIKAADLLPGLWLAPFSCDKHSTIAKLHPQWILRTIHGTVCNSANCGKFFYGLDTTHPEVQEHIRSSIEVARHVWGFEYLKLDFLYSAVLAGAVHYNRRLTKAQVLQQAMGVVRQAAGTAYVLGCGAPLGSMIGHVQANRVSADTGLSWVPEFPLPYTDKWNLPCARNCVRNTLTRLFMHRQWWVNDPDCIMLRDKLAFTQDEIIGIATTKALSGGSFIVSDDLDSISPSRLRIALQLLPPASTAAVALDLLEREVPELFRQVLPSNYSTRSSASASAVGAAGADSVGSGGYGGMYSSMYSASASNTSGAPGCELGSPSAPNTPTTPGSPISSSRKSFTSSSSAKQQQLSAKASLKEASSRTNSTNSALWQRQEKARLKNILKAENTLNEADLLGEHTLFTVCHWGEAPCKDHFVPVAQIFGAQYVQKLGEKQRVLDALIQLQAAGRSSSRLQQHLQVETSRRSLTTTSLSTTLLPHSPRYLMHMFNFWTSQYTHRVVTLQDCEVAFVAVPRHSAHIYSVSLTTDPTLPSYVGSNLHFSCGSELHRVCMLTLNPVEAEGRLKKSFLQHLQEENTAYSAPNTPREDDFAHEFGLSREPLSPAFTPTTRTTTTTTTSTGERAAEGDAQDHKHHQHKQQQQQLVPVVRTMLLSFEAGALKSASFGGAVWVFLPVNGSNKTMTSTSYSGVHVQGPAYAAAVATSAATSAAAVSGAGALHSSGASSYDASPVSHYGQGNDHHYFDHHTHYSSESEPLLLLPVRGLSAEAAAVHQDASVRQVSRVSAPDCRIHGAVYRIPVRCSNHSSHSSSSASASASAGAGTTSAASVRGADQHAPQRSNILSHSQGKGQDQEQSQKQSQEQQEVAQLCEARDYLTISWVYDLLEQQQL